VAGSTEPTLSVDALIAERDARLKREQESAEKLQRKQQEELTEFRRRLDNFRLDDAHIQTLVSRIKRAFDNGESELMVTSFPSSFCTDAGRAIDNADAPPINQPDTTEAPEPAWVATLPGGLRALYDYWKNHLRSGGFRFSARVINYPGGKPGDVGLFFSWPAAALDVKP
jgi:hypothetical protein